MSAMTNKKLALLMGDLLLKAICETTVSLCMVVNHTFHILMRHCTTKYCTMHSNDYQHP